MLTLILGGMRSGKSEVAERIAGSNRDHVTVVVTGIRSFEDPDFAARIERHRARRPTTWDTVEATDDLPGLIARCTGTVLLDALGTYISASPDFRVDIDALCRALRARAGDTIVVSDEVGLSLHPATPAGRRFADTLGECNQAVAAIADRVLLVVAGRTLDLDAQSASGDDA